MAVPRLVPGVIDSYIEARHKWRRGSTRIDILGLHVPVFPERLDGAERIAQYFATTDRVASTAFCTDADSVVRCLDDDWYGASAKGANRNGVHFEITGFADQTAAQWMDDYSVAAMERTAKVAALYVVEYDIPIRMLTVAQLKAGKRGFAKHSDIWAAFGGDARTDPGRNFPDNFFLDLVRDAVAGDIMTTPMSEWNEIYNRADPKVYNSVVEWYQRFLHAEGHLPATFHRWGYRNNNTILGVIDYKAKQMGHDPAKADGERIGKTMHGRVMGDLYEKDSDPAPGADLAECRNENAFLKAAVAKKNRQLEDIEEILDS